jgi:glycosyltransferase 2 family protein
MSRTAGPPGPRPGRRRPADDPITQGMARGLDKLFRTAFLIIPIGVIGNVAFSLFVTDREMLAAIGEFDRRYLLLALLLGVIPWFTAALRLLIWTRFLGHALRFRESLKIILATDLGAAVSPTAVGGGIFKWGLLVQRGVSPGASASLTTLAPVEDAIFFAIALPVAVVLTASWELPLFTEVAGEFRENAVPLLAIAVAIAGTTWAVARVVLGGGLGRRTQRRGLRIQSRLMRTIRATWVDARQVFRMIGADGKSRFALSMTLTSVQWISRYSIISVLLAFLEVPVQPVLFWLLQWVVFSLATLIPTPGAAGGAEAAFFVMYSAFIPAGAIGLATAAWRFFTFYLLLGIAAALYLALGGAKR